MLVAGANPYDAAAHIAAQQQYFTAPHSYTAFFYPPPFLVICYPLGFLPYFPALALWLGATGTAYLAAGRAWLRAVGVTRPVLLLAAAFPPVLITLTHGQSAFLLAALLGLGALWTGSRPVLAGICFGLAVFKPQFGVLVPVVLVLTGQWRAIVAAAVTALLLAHIATLAFGTDVWREWLSVSGAAQAALNDGAVGFAKMISPFAGARLLGVPVGPAYALQGAVALAVVAALAWASRQRGYTHALGAAMLAGAPLVTPFALDYDLVLLAFPLIWLAGNGFRPWDKLIFALAFAAPAFGRPLGVQLGIPIVPVVLAALFAVTIRRARQTAV
jgi:hypothetical protein